MTKDIDQDKVKGSQPEDALKRKDACGCLQKCSTEDEGAAQEGLQSQPYLFFHANK